jgi:hypothetical protein
MAKRKTGRGTRAGGKARSAVKAGRTAKPARKQKTVKSTTSRSRKVAAKRPAAVKRTLRSAKGTRKSGPVGSTVRTTKGPRLDRKRRTVDETVQTPPSSLNMDRRGSAARSGRAAMSEKVKQHPGMTPELTGGDVDANWENAYFSGEEAPGGDNPTPDQEVVDDIGKALGVEYQDNEELKGSDKVGQRDKHRWELDPASSEDYKDRK